MYLAGGGQPNYRTLARFRRDNAAAFTTVCQETVLLALQLGLAKLGHVALDGTTMVSRIVGKRWVPLRSAGFS